ncbi:MAG: amidohydrolase family protein [Bacteroidales bacterium]|nr:amidohydrolase family protein [Bacteroidales bacterium]
MTLLLKNARFLDWEKLSFTDTHILVEEGVNGKLFFTPKSVPDIEVSEVLDCQGKIVTKSFAVGHHHIYSALATGMPAPAKNPENFYEILKYIWWTLDKALDKEMIEASALATAVACAKAGSTFVIDHHASPNAIDGSLETIANAFEKVGVGHLLCYEVTDRDGREKAEQGLHETEHYLKKHQGLVGLHASFTVGDETMKKAVDLVEKFRSGLHIHVAEDRYDQDQALVQYGRRVLERLNDYGMLDQSKTLLVHGLHLSNHERKLFRESKAFMAENMESNLNNGVGVFNGNGLGSRIMLGTDGMHSDMIRSAQQAYFAGQSFETIGFEETYHRFRNVHRYLKENRFEGDGENNLVVLDYRGRTPVTEDNILGHFIFGWDASRVQHVISDGRLILKDSIMQTVDEAEVMTFAQEQAQRLWSRMKG